MKANELRINNLMHFPFTSENVTILGINAHEYKSEIYHTISFEKEENLYCEKLSVLKPIFLTEAWLIKLGFEYHKHQNNMFFISGMQIWVCNDLIMCNKNGIIIKYVHQLQNLYFALTNEELNIKL